MAEFYYPGVIPVVRGEEESWFDYCQKERLVIQRCLTCTAAIFYPRSLCPECLGSQLEWEEIQGKGTVYTYTVQMRPAPGFEDSEPFVIAIIELEEGVRMMSRIMCQASEVTIGMRVEVAFASIGAGFIVPVFVRESRA